MHKYLASFFFVLSVGVAGQSSAQEAAKNAAPFGLTWGMSAAEVRALGAELSEAKESDFGVSYTATKLPKVLTDVETVLLSFGYNDELWRVVVVSRDFSNDPYGGALRQRYDELSRVLAEKYGRGTQFHRDDPNPYMGADDFLMAVHMGRAWHYTDYETDGLRVQLGVGASSGSDGYWKLIFEDKALRKGFKQGKTAHEKEAL
ncbi:MAG: hypothetical protein ACM30D_09165 [Hyphomicrobiales bacterium]